MSIASKANSCPKGSASIPAGTPQALCPKCLLRQVRDYPVKAEWITSRPITLCRLNPHMQVRGKRMQYEVVYREGGRELLLSVPDYDFNWQIGYELAEPKVLPARSRILVSGAFDNSPQNLANPNPAATARLGEQSWEEMFMGFIDYAQ